MKKLFTFFSLFTMLVSYAGTPTIDGVYNASEGWGSPVATADGTVGFSNANAKKLYVTSDANYVYFAAECYMENWCQYVFAVNTKAGGGSTDSWSRTITYNHTNKPDFLFRGNVGGWAATGYGTDFYANYNYWDGAAWQGWGDANSSGNEAKALFTGGNGFVEIRVPRSVIGTVSVGDVQFIITGNQNAHGCFDAIPNDNNCTDWSAPNNASVLTNYAPNVTMPAILSYFNGDIKNNTATLNWASTSEINFCCYEVEQSIDANNFQKIATVLAKGNNQLYQFTAPIQQNTWYRLKIVDKDGKYSYSSRILLKNNSKNGFQLLGNPISNTVKLLLNEKAIQQYTVEVIDVTGKRVAITTINHNGGTSTYNFNTSKAATGLGFVKISNNEGQLVQTLKVMFK